MRDSDDEFGGANWKEPHDWFNECRGLAWMILNIAACYEQAKDQPIVFNPPRKFERFRKKKTMGGDSEFLMSSILEAKKWVEGPLREYVDYEFLRRGQ